MNISEAVENNKALPSLLFVDDEPSILMNLRATFRSGYEVTVTSDGYEAIELLKNKKFDVIVSDQRMPNITGVELLKKAFDLAPNTVRVLLTGYSDSNAILGAINDVQVHRFLQKPWDINKLRQTIKEAVQLSQTMSEKIIIDPTNSLNSADNSIDGTTLEKGSILIVDPQTTLFKQIRDEMSNNVEVSYASNVMDVFKVLESTLISTIICAFDVESEIDRTFIQMLKREHPYILVIAVCDSTDSTYLVELINKSKIFRFMKKPINMPQLSHFIKSSMVLAEQMKSNPLLVNTQHAEHSTHGNNETTIILQDQFNKINKTLATKFSKLLNFFLRF